MSSEFPQTIKKLNLIHEENFSFYEIGKDGVVVFTKIKKGTKIPSHHHKKDVCNFITCGRLELIKDGVSETIQRGNWLEIPANCEHSLIALDNVELIEIWPFGFDE